MPFAIRNVPFPNKHVRPKAGKSVGSTPVATAPGSDKTVFGLTAALLEAGNIFNFALYNKINLEEHIYRRTPR